MGFDLKWVKFDEDDAQRGRTRAGTAAERSAAELRLSIWEMASLRGLLQAARVLEWGPAGAIDELVRVHGKEEEAAEAFVARLGTYLRQTPPSIVSEPPPPGRVVAAKLLVNDGLRIDPSECVVIAETIERLVPEMVEMASWFHDGAARGGVVVS